MDATHQMKSHIGEKIAQPALRYHVPDRNGLYRPIHFFLVTKRMHQEILAERESILSGMSATDSARQQKIFERYDPALSLRGFHSILEMFGVQARR